MAPAVQVTGSVVWIVSNRRKKWLSMKYPVFVTCLLASLLPSPPVQAQSLVQPTYTLVERSKKSYGRGSQDFRGVGVVDFWFVGHDQTDGPQMAVPSVPVSYLREQSFQLPTLAVDGTTADRHQCGFLHLDSDNLIDMVCGLGADRGKGGGPNEVYRNTSRPRQISMVRVDGETLPTGIEDAAGRTRILTPFRLADGAQAVWSVVYGLPRNDGQLNINRVFRYNGAGTFRFTDQPSPAINVSTLHTCGRAGDLNGDGLDDLLLCRIESGVSVPADSLLYLQAADGSFSEAPLPMAYKRFMDAEIVDLNLDGRKDLVVSVQENKLNRIEIYLQDGEGHLPAEPTLRLPMTAPVNSMAIGDLDGDGLPDLYLAMSKADVCKTDFDLKGSMKDKWPDVVLSTGGMPAGTYLQTVMSGEPGPRGCSWLATWAGPGLVHLGRGLEGAQGDSYVLSFSAAFQRRR